MKNLSKWTFIELIYLLVCSDLYDSGAVILSMILFIVGTMACIAGLIIDNKDDKILFAKIRDDAVVPTKRSEDMGYDIYPSFEVPEVRIKPGETAIIPTGIRSAFNEKYGVILKERGSTGVKGMGIRAGVIDSGFRDEWKVMITNHNKDKNIVITKNWSVACNDNDIIYPYNKAICQAVVVEVPRVKIKEKSAEDIDSVKSERGKGMLGSSGK